MAIKTVRLDVWFMSFVASRAHDHAAAKPAPARARMAVQRARWRGVSVSVREAGLGDRLSADAGDLFFLGGGEDRQQRIASGDLCAVKRGALEEAAADGAVFLAVCGGYQLLGRYYRAADGEELPGVGLLDLWTEHPGAGAKRQAREPKARIDGAYERTVEAGIRAGAARRFEQRATDVERCPVELNQRIRSGRAERPAGDVDDAAAAVPTHRLGGGTSTYRTGLPRAAESVPATTEIARAQVLRGVRWV